VDKVEARNFVMRGDHNLVEPENPARAKFTGSATQLWRNIFSCWPHEGANVCAGLANTGSNPLQASKVLRECNRMTFQLNGALLLAGRAISRQTGAGG